MLCLRFLVNASLLGLLGPRQADDQAAFAGSCLITRFDQVTMTQGALIAKCMSLL